MRNKDIRELIKKKRVFHYEVAEALGVTATTFSKWLQRELPELLWAHGSDNIKSRIFN